MPKQRKDAVQHFGERLAQLRKEAGYTQIEFAKEVGITQRVVAYYEAPDAHPPTHLLADMAKILGVSTDELLGHVPINRRQKVGNSRLLRRLQQIEKLPPQEKRQLLQLIDAFIERWQLKNKIQHKAA